MDYTPLLGGDTHPLADPTVSTMLAFYDVECRAGHKDAASRAVLAQHIGQPERHTEDTLARGYYELAMAQLLFPTADLSADGVLNVLNVREVNRAVRDFGAALS